MKIAYACLVFMMAGTLATAVLFQGPVKIGFVHFDIHTMLYSAIMIVIGFQCVTFYFFAKIFAIKSGIDNNKEWLTNFNRYFSLERGLGTGAFVLLSGITLTVHSLSIWDSQFFGDLNPLQVLRFVIPAVACLLLGVQIIFNSFFTSILHLKVQQ